MYTAETAAGTRFHEHPMGPLLPVLCPGVLRTPPPGKHLSRCVGRVACPLKQRSTEAWWHRRMHACMHACTVHASDVP